MAYHYFVNAAGGAIAYLELLKAISRLLSARWCIFNFFAMFDIQQNMISYHFIATLFQKYTFQCHSPRNKCLAWQGIILELIFRALFIFENHVSFSIWWSRMICSAQAFSAREMANEGKSINTGHHFKGVLAFIGVWQTAFWYLGWYFALREHGFLAHASSLCFWRRKNFDFRH